MYNGFMKKHYTLKVKNKGWFKNQHKQIQKKCSVCFLEFKFYLSAKNRKYCSKKCYRISQKGKKRPEQSKKMKGRPSPMKGKKHSLITRLKLSGKNSSHWNGGVTSLYHKIRRLPEYDKWRLSVYQRDLFTCKKCNKKGIRLECHHIVSLSSIIKNNLIITISQALKCNLLWNVNNGLTLCKECHKLTDTYGNNTK
jgi:5-methylcytosine-specific restriction endonuclease McrA